jgi:GNAT superfamily N-acetyltransferase
MFHEVVMAGASMGFLDDMTLDDSVSFWNKKFASLGPEMAIALAEEGSDLVGFALLVQSTMPNGVHRAEIQKVVTSPSHRRRGIASGVLTALEDEAKRVGLRLLFLDTEENSSGEQFYRAHGWTECGRIPEFAIVPGGDRITTVLFYKLLD